MNQTARVNSN